jgi:hypothetical protein
MIFLLFFILVALPVQAIDADWIVGKWELTYDPDGAEKDWMDFLPDGDVYSTGPNGKVEGIYVVAPDSVKAVFTYEGSDIIMTFFFNEEKTQLRIVTSRTGKESIYTKIPNEDDRH